MQSYASISIWLLVHRDEQGLVGVNLPVPYGDETGICICTDMAVSALHLRIFKIIMHSELN